MPIQKDIDPRGFLLNDNDTGVDHLSMSTFAEAIAESLHHVETPITVGLYGKWGSGKSFRLRQIENILDRFQKQQEINEKKIKKTKRKTDPHRLRCKHACRAFLWAVCIVLVFVMLLGTFMLAVKPSLLTDCFGLNLTEADDTESEEVTDKPDDEIDKPVSVLRVLKIVGLILLPIELLMVFVIGCFGSSWLSPDHYGSCKLLTYGAFTKLPLRTSDNAIVEDPGDSPAEVLKYVKPGDETLAMAVADAPVYRRNYIFVNFKAWEYAGSDTLWAAIVTKMTDAIEAEFGTITARLFRMLKIEKIKKNICRNDARTIYVELMEQSSEDAVMDMMQQYGVVKCCQKLPNSNKHYWQVEYSSDVECRNAKECLKIENVPFTVKISMPDIAKEKSTDGTISRAQPSRESGRELIEMTDLSRRRPTHSNCDSIDLNRWRSPTNGCCCNRFCRHFMRHPIKILCLPRLIWWILILACAVLTPLIAYIEAEYFQLDIYRTYRAIPIYGQILLWLPAASAVSALAIRFVWAMCHSQRKRINAALDGTKKNMAEQLGFMSKVKSEIEVVTKLIHCARFTHQKDYKIVITIDDLDRIEMHKIQSVLEALNILLSDVSAPFICLVAVDSRVAVKCIEENMGDVLKESRITGQEYLKKIINLPICLPEINDSGKKRFIAGLIDQADRAVTYRIENEKSILKPNQDLKENSPIWQGRQSRGDEKQLSAIHYGSVSPDGSDESLIIDREDDIDAAVISTDNEGDALINKKVERNGNIPTVITVDSAASTSKNCEKIQPVRNHQHDSGQVARSKTTKLSTKAIVHAQTTDVNGNISRPLSDHTAMATTTTGQEIQTERDKILHKTTMISGSCGNKIAVSEEQTDGNVLSRRTGIEENNNQPRVPACETEELELDHEKFLFECRHYIYNDADLHKHIHGNPRNIKRIFNVVSLTASLINSSLKKKNRRDFIHFHSKENQNRETDDSSDSTKRTRSLAADIVRWVILTDQWPYRTSYILQVIEDASQRHNAGLLDEQIPDNWTIFEIYENKVKEECLKGEAWLSLDGDPDLFFSFLVLLRNKGFTTQKILKLQNYIVNLDHSIRHAISFERDISVLTFNPQTNSPIERCSTPSDEPKDSLQNDVPAAYEEVSSPLRKNKGRLPRPCT